MSVKHKRMFDGGDDSLHVLALQAHQISGSIDPSTPIRALLGPAPKLPPERLARSRSFDLAAKLKDPEIARLVNERLAPGLN